MNSSLKMRWIRSDDPGYAPRMRWTRSEFAISSQAGKVAQAINAGKYCAAEAMLGSNTPYRTASQNVVVAIAAVKTEGGL